jgi:microcin C transport system substrate-binding protein
MQDGFGQFTDGSIKARPFDPVRAAEAFAKAGFKTRGPDGILTDAQGKRLSFTITNGYKPLENALVVIKQEAVKAGVEFNIETLESTAAFKKVNEKQHEIAFSAYNVSVEMYPRFWEDFAGVNAYEKDGSIKKYTNNVTLFNDKEMNEWIDRYDKSEDINEMKDLAFKMERRVHDAAIFIPAFKMPWYRVAFWRWMKWPKDFDAKTVRDFEESWGFWIDEAERKTTLDSMRSGGPTFPKEVGVYDKWRDK